MGWTLSSLHKKLATTALKDKAKNPELAQAKARSVGWVQPDGGTVTFFDAMNALFNHAQEKGKIITPYDVQKKTRKGRGKTGNTNSTNTTSTNSTTRTSKRRTTKEKKDTSNI